MCFIDFLDKSGWIPGYHSHRRNVFGHYTARPDNCAVANTYSGKDGRIDSYPYLILNDNRTAIGSVAILRIGVVVDCNQIDFRSDKYFIANRYAAATEESAALLDEAPFSDSDRLTVVM